MNRINGRTLRGLLLSLLMVLLAIGMMGTAYARTDDCAPMCDDGRFTPQCNGGSLQIKDQNEPWGDGASGTWRASNMAPGNQYDFTGSFVGLRSSSKGRVDITCDYRVLEERPVVESDSDPFTNLHPGKMANELILTRCVYKAGAWQIDLLTGVVTGMTAKERRTYQDGQCIRWQIPDVNRDGRITFYDLKNGPLKSLPLPDSSRATARMEIGVKFATSAGNDLQGDTFNMTMQYTYKP